MKNSLIFSLIAGLILGGLAYLFGNYDARNGMSHADSLAKARAAKAAKAQREQRTEDDQSIEKEI